MAFYNRDNVFTRNKQAKKRIHIDLKQDNQTADILGASLIPHRVSESEKALNHAPKNEAQFDTDDPNHCKRQRGEKPTEDPQKNKDSHDALPISHQEEFLEPKIETVIEGIVHQVAPSIDVSEIQINSNHNNAYTIAKQQGNPTHPDKSTWNDILQTTAVVDKAETQSQPPSAEKHTDAERNNVFGEETNAMPSGNTKIKHASYNRDNVFTKAKQEKRQHQSNLDGKDQIHHQTYDVPTGSGMNLDAVDTKFKHTSNLEVQYDITGRSSIKKHPWEVDGSVNTDDSRVISSSVVPTDSVGVNVPNEMSSSSNTASIILPKEMNYGIQADSEGSLQPTAVLDSTETQFQPSTAEKHTDGVRNSSVFDEETNTTMSTGNTKINRVSYNRDNFFTKAKQQKRLNQRVQCDIEGQSPLKEQACEVYDSVNSVASRLTSSSVVPTDPVVVKVSNEMIPFSKNTSIIPYLDSERMGTEKTVDPLKPDVENFTSFIHIHQDPSNLITFDWDSSLPNDMNHPIQTDSKDSSIKIKEKIRSNEQETTEKMGLPPTYIQQTEMPATVLTHLVTVPIDVTKNHATSNSDHVYTKTEQHPNIPISDDRLKSKNATATLDNAEMQPNQSTVIFNETAYLDVKHDIGGRSPIKKPVRIVRDSIVPTNTVTENVSNEMESSSKKASSINSVAQPNNVNDNQAKSNRDDNCTKTNQQRNRHPNMTKRDKRQQPQSNAITVGNAQMPTAGQRSKVVRSNALGEATSTGHIKNAQAPIQDNGTFESKLERPRKQPGATHTSRPQQEQHIRKKRSDDIQSRIQTNRDHAEQNRPSNSSFPLRSTNNITQNRASNRERRKDGCCQCTIS